jgi:dolichol-phosphate mannosyltransferase
MTVTIRPLRTQIPRPRNGVAAPAQAPARPLVKDPVRVTFDDPAGVTASNRSQSRPRTGTGFLPYRYLIGEDLSVGSQVPLTELGYFREPRLGRDLDIEIRVGKVGSAAPRSRARLVRFAGPNGVRYEEHLGRLGANFAIDMGDQITVTISSLLARSPHVAYTNIVEALLRFALASRGQMLLHSACLELDGRGVMLSAKTDTGKTGTVLRLLRERGARFLSDDMTIISADGTANCFPKPLTISSHTLRAVDPGDLSRVEWMKLSLKSKIHSKGGRGIGLWMGNANLPIMSANAFTQLLVPPPKYGAERLVACEVIDTTRVEDLFIIERGDPALSDVPHEEAITDLLANTEDAYGFPPFRFLAPVLVIGGEEYAALMCTEREILSNALTKIRVRRLASNNFGWADQIPDLLVEEIDGDARH